jgi:hypothetical protein
LREENRLKGDLNKQPALPSIVTEEQKAAQVQARKDLDKKDREDAKQEKALAEAQPANPEERQPITGKLDISSLKFT